ncbi:hypothetical protein [Brachybacterium sp. GPGPB12]|uniref:hypothetical protein n=1 Tax=Brachybacterium sp. GPGPB12 TaxID=3023517 RepID=UPI0031345AB6
MAERRMRRGEECATPHGETPYSPTSLLRALTADPYSVDPRGRTSTRWSRPRRPTTVGCAPSPSSLAVPLGFAVAVSVVDLRQEAAGADSPRAPLEEEVREVRAETDLLEDRRTLLEQEILEAQEEVLDTADGGSAERIGEYERAGYGVSLTGPGVRLTLDDSAPRPPAPARVRAP